MCDLCGTPLLAYANGSTVDNAAPQYSGSGANSWTTQGTTSNININGVLSGNKWAGSSLTYSFTTLSTQYDAGYGTETSNGFSPATEGIKTAIRAAYAMVGQYTNLVPTEVSASSPADTKIAISADANPTAYAYYPSNQPTGGDIWFGTDYLTYSTAVKGQYEWTTAMHELGHSLGLKHGHETGGVANTALQTSVDQMPYSIMTYRSYQGASTIFGYTNELNGYAQSFMMYDIAALQTMYGANFNTNSGNTTYTWSPTTGEMFINGVGQGAPGGNRIFMTLWDGNGSDTYDFSNFTSNLQIDLTPGAFSKTSPGQLADLGFGHYAPGNIFNALQYNGDARSLIENATGGSGNDTIYGNSANNTLIGGSGADALFGGIGADTLAGGIGNDTLVSDGPLVMDDNAGTIRRLYLATLNRAPDDSGFSGWTGALTGGQSLASITTGFINSTEFQTTYGALNNQQFVTLLYNNVLHRAPDAGGLSGWTGSLNAGASRESVVIGFSESAEFRVASDVREHSGQIFRLYDTTFNRLPDNGGFNGWMDSRYGGTDLKAIATLFMNSQEFTNTYGTISAMTDTQFVTLLYDHTLHRLPDAGGLSGWVGALGNGSLTRADVLLQFSESNEHFALTNNALSTYMRTSFTIWNDVLEGGVGNDILSGGRGSDKFVFDFSSGGTDTIYGFESIDSLQLRGFGYTSAADALAHMTQTGSDVVLNHGANSIIFHDTQLTTLQNMTSSGWIFA